MYAEASDADNWLTLPCDSAAGTDEQRRIEKLKSLDADESLCIEGSGRTFFAPRSLDQFAGLVAEYPAATILAGGTDIGLWVTKQHRSLDVVIYTGNVYGLNDLGIVDGCLDIGAAVSLTDAMALIFEHYPTLEELFVRFASPPIRNAGTLGGNIANGSPIGDSMPALMVLDTGLVLRAGENTRSIALSDFYPGYMQTALQPGEFLERIRIPLPAGGEHVRSYKVSKRFDQDISAVCGAYRLRLDGDTVAEIKIAYGGMAAVPARAMQCEESLLGGKWNGDSIDKAMSALDRDFTPISDMRSSSEYRRQVCKNLLKRLYLETGESAAVGVYSYGR